MSIFDLLFLLCALATVSCLLAASILALCGQRARARAVLLAWIMAAALYLAVVTASHLATPLAVLHPHDPQCSDDWCFVVEKAGRDAPGGEIYRVSIKIYSRALRVEQRERGVVVYLTDPAGHRFNPDPQPGDVPFDTLLGPGEAATLSRTFRVPPVRPLYLHTTHEGDGFPMGALIIGRSPFDARTVVRLD